jgi:uncharacterized RDD family membrane protein YckC
VVDDDRRDRAAGALPRGLALTVDLVLISVAALIASALLPRSLVLSAAEVPLATRSSGAAWLQMVVVLGLSFLYVVRSWTRRGATVGDRLLRVRRHSHDGSPVTVRGAVLAWVLVVAPPSLATAVGAVAPLAGGAVWIVLLVWYLTLAFTCRSARISGALHDRWTAISVVQRGRSHAPAPVPEGTTRPATP